MKFTIFLILSFITGFSDSTFCLAESTVAIYIDTNNQDASVPSLIPLTNDELFCKTMNSISKENQESIYRVFNLFRDFIENKRTLYLDPPYMEDEVEKLQYNYFHSLMSDHSNFKEIESAFKDYLLAKRPEITQDDVEELPIFLKEEVILSDLIRYGSLQKLQEYVAHLRNTKVNNESTTKWDEILSEGFFPDFDISFRNPDQKVIEYLTQLNREHKIESLSISLDEAPDFFKERFDRAILDLKITFESLIRYEQTSGHMKNTYHSPSWAWYYLNNIQIKMREWKSTLTEEEWDKRFGALDETMQNFLDLILARTRFSISSDCKKFKTDATNAKDLISQTTSSKCEEMRKMWVQQIRIEVNKNISDLSDQMLRLFQTKKKDNNSKFPFVGFQKVIHFQSTDCFILRADIWLVWEDQNIFLLNRFGDRIQSITKGKLFSLLDIEKALN